MIIRDLLKEFIPSNEIRARINTNTIKINGDSITLENLNNELDILDGYWEFEDFIYESFFKKLSKTKGDELVLHCFNIEDFFGQEESNIHLFRWLSGFLLLTIGKKQKYVFMYK